MALFRQIQLLEVSKIGQRIAFEFKLPEVATKVVAFDVGTSDIYSTTGRVVVSNHRHPVVLAINLRHADFTSWVPELIEPDQAVDYDVNGTRNGTRHSEWQIGSLVSDTYLHGYYQDTINSALGIDRVYKVMLYLTYEMP